MDRRKDNLTNYKLNNFNLNSSSSMLVESPLGKILLEKNISTPLHAASLMKLPIMSAVFQLNEENKIKLSEKIKTTDKFKSYIKNKFFYVNKTLPKEITIFELVKKMICHSDNQATNILFDLVGVENIKRTLATFNMNNTKILRKVMDIPAFDKGINNTTTCLDIRNFYYYLLKGDISDCSKNRMLSILQKQKIRDRIPQSFPKNILIAHKTGSITNHIYDSGIIFTDPKILLVIMLKDYSYDEGINKIRNISKEIYLNLVKV